MNERIEVGDLVMVVRLKPCGHGNLGKLFVVRGVTPNLGPGATCLQCGALTPGPVMVAHVDDACSHTNCVTIPRLKRIPPLTEPAHHEEKGTA